MEEADEEEAIEKYKAYLPLTFEEKSQLTKQISEANKELLTSVVKTVMEKCPQAIGDGKMKSTLEIELNMFDRPTYSAVREILA